MCASCPSVQNPMAVDDDLPPGYKFRPDKEQLLVHYLRPKLDGEDFAQELVPFCDLYFFTQLKTKTPKGKHIKRTVGSGTWKGEDAPKEVLAASQRVIGKRRRFRYGNDKDSAQNDRWLMHEFELDASLLRNKRKAKDYVLCIVRKKSRSVKKNSEDQEGDETSCDGGDDQQDGDLPEAKKNNDHKDSETVSLEEMENLLMSDD